MLFDVILNFVNEENDMMSGCFSHLIDIRLRHFFGFIQKILMRFIVNCWSFPPREDNIPWNSNVIMHRVSNSMIKTVSGRVYILVGKMNLKVEPGKLT